MINYLLSFIFIVSFAYASHAQDVIIDEIPFKDTTLKKIGPNLKHYTNYYISYGQVVGYAESDGSNIRYGLSPQWSFGERYKLKLTNTFATGFEFSYNQYSYTIEQSASKLLPNATRHKKEKIRLYAISLAPYIRINFDSKRGNYMGYFLDLGGFGDLYFIKQHITTDKLNDGTVQKITTSRLKFIEQYRYGIYAQLGFNKYLIYCNYYLSNLFTSASNYAEMPNMTAGIKFSFHK